MSATPVLLSSVDTEGAVLGMCLSFPGTFEKVLESAKTARYFSVPEYQAVYNAMAELHDSGKQIDMLTVMNHLGKSGTIKGPASILSGLPTGNNSHLEAYLTILTEKYVLREVISISQQMEDMAHRGDAVKALESAQERLTDLAVDYSQQTEVIIGDLMVESIKNMATMMDSDSGGITGVPSGLPELDQCTAGFQNSDVIIVAARPGMGKTALALTIARNASVYFSKPVGILSMEMAKVQLANRMMSMEAQVDSSKFRSADFTEAEWDQLLNKTTRLQNAQVWIDDTAGLNISKIRVKCKRMKARGAVMIIIDYLQLAAGEGKNREEVISRISREVKVIAKELNIPIIELSQLNRAVEARADRRPMLSDLRESGSIEQDADMVILLYRPEYYGIEQYENGSSTAGVAELIIAKHRHGALKTIYTKWIDKYTEFRPLTT